MDAGTEATTDVPASPGSAGTVNSGDSTTGQAVNPNTNNTRWISIHPKVTLEDWTYGEEPNEPVVEGNPAKAEVVFTYKPAGADDDAFTEEVPTEANDYIVRATVKSSYPYTGGRAEAEFSILKADPSIGTVTATLPANSLDITEATVTRENEDVPGMIGLLSATELTWGENEVGWFFTPQDADNYEAANGELTLVAWQDGWVRAANGDWSFYAQGEMVTGWLEDQTTGNDFWFDDEGVMTQGWQNVNGSWRYFGGSGRLHKGWLRNGGAWYWLNPAKGGAMATGWNKIDGVWYFFQQRGAAKGALLRNGMTPDGARTDANGAWIQE